MKGLESVHYYLFLLEARFTSELRCMRPLWLQYNIFGVGKRP